MRKIWLGTWCLAAALVPYPAFAQDGQELDRSDPAILEQQATPDEEPRPRSPRLDLDSSERLAAAAPADEIVVGAVRITGASRLPVATFADAIEPFLGRPLDHRELVRLATAIAAVARHSGYGLATAWVPEQDMVAGILNVVVDEGRIDEIRGSGPGAAMVEQRLAAFASGEPVRTDALERELLIIGDGAGMWIGNARIVREGGRKILTVATRHNQVSGRITIDNRGSANVGPLRAWVEIDVNGVILTGDGVTVAVATTPLSPETFQLIEAHYRTPINAAGTTLGIGGFFGRTDVEPDADTRGYQGNSWTFELEAAHPLLRSRARSLWLTGRLELRDSELNRAGVAERDDRLATATASLYGYDRFAGGRLRGRVSLVQGFNVFGATRLGDPLASRSDADGVFTKVEAWGEFSRRLGGGFSTVVAMRGQIADGPLLSSEEMGLGGPQFLRAFDYREFSGDEGIAASMELTFEIKDVVRGIRNTEVYAYSDAGQVSNDGGQGRSGELASVGGGVRVSVAHSIDAGLEVGVALTEGNNNDNPKPRVSFTLRNRF